MTVPEVNADKAGGAVDVAELRRRAQQALDSLQGDLDTLNRSIAGLPGSPDPVRTALLACNL